MARFNRNKWKERNVAHDRRHRWPVSINGIVMGAIELHGSTFVTYTIKGEPVGKFTSLTDARQALTQRS